MTADHPAGTALPRIERRRFDTRRRQLTVTASDRITPAMLRLTLEGPDLADFQSLSPGDHIKVFVPDGAGGTAMRDYTPRRYDTAARRLVLDFALHDAGPATVWAMNARPGDLLEIGGPRGSQIISGPIAQWLLIGDETALPSIGRRIEEMATDVPVTSLVAVPGPEDEQRIGTAARHRAIWVHRSDPADPAPLLEALRDIALPPGTFAWIAAEGGVTRALRAHLLEERGHPKEWLRASGYWVMGQADATEKFD